MVALMFPICQFPIINKISKLGKPMVEQKELWWLVPPDLPFVGLMIDPWRVGIKGSCRRAMQIFVYSNGSQTLSTQNLSLLASDWILQTPFHFITQWVSSFMSLRECFSAFVLVLGLRSAILHSPSSSHPWLHPKLPFFLSFFDHIMSSPFWRLPFKIT